MMPIFKDAPQCEAYSHFNNKKGAMLSHGAFFEFNPGIDLLSHTASSAVPSAQEGLTAVFGMGTGVTPLTLTPRNRTPAINGAGA
jgi:hypothetical protein